jgi:ornithine cyclodeaminase/alanine dehydrogenase-like protein (mu-crystallin family)
LNNESLFVGHREVSQLLPMGECIEVIEQMFKTLARGEAILPLRQVVPTPDKKGALAQMGAYLGSSTFNVIGGKFISVFPGNLTTEYESHQGCVLLFECVNGRLLAVIDASSVTAIRTAAASAVATKVLARKNSTNLAILGSGTQASMHLLAMREVRPIRRVKVWSRNKAHAKSFASKHSVGSSSQSFEIKSVGSVREAVEDVDIICTTTATRDPILSGDWIPSGCHVNAVGASRPQSRELDSRAVANSRLYADRMESLLNEADEYLIPKSEGVLTDRNLVGEIGQLLLGQIPGRTSDSEITLFKSLGIATEDLAAACHIYKKCEANKKLGTWLDFSGMRGA